MAAGNWCCFPPHTAAAARAPPGPRSRTDTDAGADSGRAPIPRHPAAGAALTPTPAPIQGARRPARYRRRAAADTAQCGHRTRR